MSADVLQWFIFAIFTILTLGGGIGVVASPNLFHAALWLLVSLFGVAGFFVTLAAPFLAAIQVLVYMGAIVILIIFAIMLTRRLMGLHEQASRQWPVALLGAGLMFLVIALALVLASTGESPLLPREALGAVSADSIRDLGVALVDLNQYVLPFLLASVLLEGAMVGSIILANDKRD